MCSQKYQSCNMTSILLVTWLIGLTAAGIIAYLQLSHEIAHCGHSKNSFQDDDTILESDNASVEKLWNDAVQILTDRLDEQTSNRDRRSLPTEMSSGSSSTLLLSLLKKLIADSLTEVCRPSDKICLPGPEGRKGEQGQQGWPGYKGGKGLPGILGRQGTAGKQGPRGAHGAKGETGDIGQEGRKGDTGVKGRQGEVGEKGAVGEKGNIGFPGYKGQKGEREVDGLRGEKGERGNVSIVVDKGDKGQKGVKLPSECSNYNVLYETWRKVSQTNGSGNCDSKLSGWKRFADGIGGKMPEICPSTYYRCGTDAPGWLNGTHPTIVGH